MFLTVLAYAVVACVALLAGLFLLGKPLLNWARNKEFTAARERFRIQREQLEARFFDMASVAGKPRDLTWVDCQWLDTVSYARDVKTNQLAAFVAVNISFEAVEGLSLIHI